MKIRNAAVGAFATSWFLLMGCASTPSAERDAPAAASGERFPGMHRVPLQKSGQGAALLTTTLNGTPITLLVDTGAQSTVIDLRVAQKAGVKLQPGALRSIGVGPGVINARQGEVVTLDLAGYPAQVRPTLQDFSGLIAASRRWSSTPIVGLLGYDVMSSCGAILDLDEGAMYLKKR